MRHLRKIVAMCGAILLLTGCATVRLKRNLSPPLKDWLEYHIFIMDSKVPKWLDERGGSEHKHFLRLPREMQIEYTHYFWKIRREGAKEEFYYRIAVAERSLGGIRTDMGNLYIACGSPLHTRFVTTQDLQRGGGRKFVHSSDIQGNVYQIWYYSMGSTQIKVVFEWRYNRWEFGQLFSIGVSNLRRLMSEKVKVFYPTPEGWELWGERVLEWVHEQEKKAKK